MASWPMTKISLAILAAYQKGYRASESGQVYKPCGEVVRLHSCGDPKKPYLTFRSPGAGRWVNVPVHKFVSFCKFGESSLREGTHTRHLNGNPTDNRWENIAIGSRSDNMMDREASQRRLHAQKAGRARSLPDSVWSQVMADRDGGATYEQLGEKYRLSKSTLSFRLSQKAKKRVLGTVE